MKLAMACFLYGSRSELRQTRGIKMDVWISTIMLDEELLKLVTSAKFPPLHLPQSPLHDASYARDQLSGLDTTSCFSMRLRAATT